MLEDILEHEKYGDKNPVDNLQRIVHETLNELTSISTSGTGLTGTLDDVYDDSESQDDMETIDNKKNHIDNKKNHIHDIVIKQLDFGYVVKVGCQDMGISSAEELIKMFSDYVKQPLEIEKQWVGGIYGDKPEKPRKPNSFNIGIVAKNKQDFKNYSNQFPHKISRNAKRFSLKILDSNDEMNVLTYYCLSTIDDCRGIYLDKMIETNQARQNSGFEHILTLNTFLLWHNSW